MRIDAETFLQIITGSITGNAATATALQNARTINGVSFNGTGNVVNTTADIADSSNKRYVTDAYLTLLGLTSGTNTGDLTLGAVGSSPNANGATLTAQAFVLQPADGTNPGALTAGTQTIGGAKTFNTLVTAPGFAGSNTAATTLFTSEITAAAASTTVAAFTFKPTNALTSTDLVVDIQNSSGVRLFSVSHEGKVVILGASGAASLNLQNGDISTGAGADILGGRTVSSGTASGGQSFKSLDGGRWNFSTADASAYLYRSSSNTITTPGTLQAASLILNDGVYTTNSFTMASGNRILTNAVFQATGGFVGNSGSVAEFPSGTWHALRADLRVASGSNAIKSLDGARWNFSTSDASAYLARNAADVINTPGKLTATAGLGVGNSAAATTLGTVTKKMEIFDATGTSLGFIAIYDALT